MRSPTENGTSKGHQELVREGGRRHAACGSWELSERSPSVRQESSAGPGALQEADDAGIAEAPLDFLASVASERAASKCWWQRRTVPWDEGVNGGLGSKNLNDNHCQEVYLDR